MACATFHYTVLVFLTILLAENGVEARNDPKVFTKDGDIHIRSGDNGNIVFEHPSPEGKVFVAGQELKVNNITGQKGDKGDRGPPGTDVGSGIKGETGSKGEQGLPGTNGTTGPPGIKGNRGDLGPVGRNGSQGSPGVQGDIGAPGQNGSSGPKGDPGLKGEPGLKGSPGSRGPTGPPGLNGTAGEKRDNGTQGLPGIKGEKGDNSDYTAYFRGNESHAIQCNSSNHGVLRYSMTQLQLCTPRGWRYLSFEEPAGCSDIPDVANVPETNYQTFRNADFGIMFQFNGQFTPSVSRPNLNITTDISPVNSTLSYQDAIMRQGAFFPGNGKHLIISGISDDFWIKSNWSVMALLKFRDIGQTNIRVLGHGVENRNRGLHLGIVGSDKKVIHGYYSNDFTYAVVAEDTWYHITWTSEKYLSGKEKRCIIVDGNVHNCGDNVSPYQGSGPTTVGSWWNGKHNDNLLLDNLIITSGIVHYETETNAEKQVCFAKTLDKSIP